MAVNFDNMLGRALSILGTAATWTPSGAESSSVKIMPSREDELVGFGETRVLAENRLICEMQVSYGSPAEGDTITVSGTVYVIKHVRFLDEERLIWLIDCYKQ